MPLVQAQWQLMVLMAVVGLGVTAARSAVATLAQTLVAKKLLGRAQAALDSAISLATVVSQAPAGVLAAVIGIRTVFLVGAGAHRSPQSSQSGCCATRRLRRWNRANRRALRLPRNFSSPSVS